MPEDHPITRAADLAEDLVDEIATGPDWRAVAHLARELADFAEREAASD